VQKPEAAPSKEEEEENEGERVNGEESVVSTFQRNFSFR